MRSRSSSGSTLLLVVVLLLVLSVIGVAAVAVSSQERSNASAKGDYDRLMACAAAGQAQLFAELARYGPTYMIGSGATTLVSLPGGNQVALGHYGAPANPPPIKSVVVTRSNVAPSGGVAQGDRTNTIGGGTPLAGATVFVATCKDRDNHEFEVEFITRFALVPQ